MSAIKIRDNIWAVGTNDPDVRIFHGYETPCGTSYNTYLVQDGENFILIDNVKAAFTDEFIANIEEVVAIEKITHIIQNHIEPDHSGSLTAITSRIPEVPVYCTAGAKKGISAYYGAGTNCVLVKKGETLCTGKYTFAFIPAPMVHWPDSMLTYLVEEKILFANDAFGQHICPEGAVYDGVLGKEKLFERAGDYYANIVLPFGAKVTALLDAASSLEIEMICPSHGVIIRDYIGEMVAWYKDWAANVCDENKVVIIYDSMWGATEEMAEEIAAELFEQGKTVKLYHLRDTHPSEVMGMVLDAKHIYVGASTLNKTMMPTVAAFLTYMKGLAPQNRIGMAFGSHGWSGEGAKEAHAVLENMGFEMLPIKTMVYMGK